MIPARRKKYHVSIREENWTARSQSHPNFRQQDQLIELLHGADFSTMPHPHSIRMSAGGVAEIYRLNSMVWRLTWDRLIAAFSNERYVYFFLLPTKRHSTNNNFCDATLFGHVDRAIFVISTRLRDEPIWFGVAYRTHIENSLHSGG